MLDRAFALLDSPHLSRLGNLRTLITIGVAGALILIGLILAVVQLLTKVGWVPLLFLGAGLTVVFGTTISHLLKRLTDRLAEQPAPSPPAEPAWSPPSLPGEQVLMTAIKQAKPLTQSERLVAFYREGEQLRARIFLSGAFIPGDLVHGVANQRQVERERWARDWDKRVLDALADDTRQTWSAAAALPEHRLDPASTIAGVRTFLATKLVCLKEIIRQLDPDQPGAEPADSARGIATETVTPESIERELSAFVPWAGRMLQGEVTQEQVTDWAEKVGISIRARGPEGEEDMFLAVGHNLDPRAELEAKVARLQDHILPKVRGGEWTR